MLSLIENNNEQQTHIIYWHFRFVIKVPKAVLKRYDRVVVSLPDQKIMKQKLADQDTFIPYLNLLAYLGHKCKLKNIHTTNKTISNFRIPFILFY